MENISCDTCWYYDYDEEFDEYYCMMDLDEDEAYRFFLPGRHTARFIVRAMTIPWQESNNVKLAESI